MYVVKLIMEYLINNNVKNLTHNFNFGLELGFCGLIFPQFVHFKVFSLHCIL